VGHLWRFSLLTQVLQCMHMETAVMRPDRSSALECLARASPEAGGGHCSDNGQRTGGSSSTWQQAAVAELQ
jgi:hypothetical protein